MDCCRCGRGALSARLTLLSVLGPDERISGLSLFAVHCRGAFLGVTGGGCRREGVKHRGEFCHQKSAPHPRCGAGDEGRELAGGSGGSRDVEAPLCSPLRESLRGGGTAYTHTAHSLPKLGQIIE